MNGTNIHTAINIAILSPKNKDCIEINYRIMNTLIQDYAQTYYNADSLDFEDKSGEHFILLGF
jgi:hypothetical protein